jgi:hypothetical protein
MATYVGTIDASLSTGNVSYTSVGFAPLAVIFWGTIRTSAGATEDAAYSGFKGMTDGTTSHCNGMSGAAPSANDHYVFSDTSAIKLINVSGTILAEAEIVSLDSDGFTLNWTTAAGSSYDINFMAIAGSNISNVKVGLMSVNSTGSTAETGVGFQPDFLMFLYAQSGSHPFSTLNGVNTIGQGFDDGTDQTSRACYWRSSIIDSGNSWITDADSLITMNSNNAPAQDGAGRVASMDSDGFTVTMDSIVGTLQIGYLAIKGGSHKILSFALQGSTGDEAETGVGFEPDGLMLNDGPVDANVSPTVDTGWEGSDMSLGASDGTRTRFAQWGCDVNGDGGCYQDETNIIARANSIDGVDAMTTQLGDRATLSSFDADGFTLNHSAVDDGTSRIAFGWAMGLGTVTGTFDNKIIYADGVTVV